MARTDVLVTADWAEQNLTTPGVVLVEVDEDAEAYDGGHVAGAVKVSWSTDLQDHPGRDVVSKADFEALMGRLGISNDDTVVLYGGNNNWFAAYAYWELKLYGHEKVVLLDGGRKKWELDGRELTTEVPERTPTTYTAQEPDLSIRAFRDEVIAAIGTKNLVDVRSPDEFSGKIAAPAHLPQEQSQRSGHIPTAINVPWSKAANEDGTFRSDAELTALYGDAGFSDASPTIAYCRIGERSSHTWFVLHELLGHPDVKNYDGSWTEYGSLVGAPIALGAGSAGGPLMCGAPAQARSLPAGTDLGKETVLVGRVLADGHPVGGAYVRLLDGTGEFTAEVVSSASGDFRFFSAPGTWTLRVLSRAGGGEARIDAPAPGLHEVDVHLG